MIAAYRERATGSLTLQAGRARSRIFWRNGEVVGAELGWGYRSLGQALLQAGRMPLPQLDALWAAGELERPDPELLTRLEIREEPEALLQLQWLARLSAVVASAQSARFEEGILPPAEPFVLIAGDSLLRNLGLTEGLS